MFLVRKTGFNPILSNQRLNKENSNKYVEFLKTIQVGEEFIIPLDVKSNKKNSFMMTLSEDQIKTQVNRIHNLVSRKKLGITLSYNMTECGMIVKRKK